VKASTRQTLVTLGPLVVGSSAAGVIAVWLVRQLVPVADLMASNDVVGNYLQTLGGIYAVLLAFVVFVVWTQFNDARNYVEREANDLQDLYRVVTAMEAEALIEPLRRYCAAVIDEEWSAMGSGDEATMNRVGKILEEEWGVLHRFEARGECQRSLHDDALGRFHELCDARTERLSAARTHIPLALHLLLDLGALVLVGSFLLLGVERFAIHAMVTGAMAGAVAHILYVVHDLDDCFSGAWQVSPAPFARVRRFMAEPPP
jgi:hypothetical protein